MKEAKENTTMNITITHDTAGNVVTRATFEGKGASVTTDNISDHVHYIAATLQNRLSAKHGGYGPRDGYEKIRARLVERIGFDPDRQKEAW